MNALRAHKGIVISKKEAWTDYIINVKHYDRGFTGQLCTWLANVMTTGEVILCGMDSYSSEKKYFHNQVFNKGNKVPVENYLRQWRLAVDAPDHIQSLPNPERVSVMSGPLQEIFKKYEEG